MWALEIQYEGLLGIFKIKPTRNQISELCDFRTCDSAEELLKDGESGEYILRKLKTADDKYWS